MRVIFDAEGGMKLEAADALDRFDARSDCPAALIDKALEGIGRRDGESHVWISQAWLLSHGPQDPAWRAGLDAMTAYARSRGWVDAAGAIRAHLAPAGGDA